MSDKSQKKAWYETGYDGAEKEADKRSMGYPPDRFWQNAGSSKQIVFVSDDPFCINEHSWCDGEKKWHHATCTAKIDDAGCAACGARGVGRSDYVGHYTIVDITGYKNKEGVDIQYRLMLLPAKTKVLNKFKMKKENRGSLLGQVWTLARADANAPNTGDDLDHVREITNMDGLFSMVTFKGKGIKDMIEKANAGNDAKARKYLAYHFQIPESGPIPMRIPQFNYPELMAPLSFGALKSQIANATPFDKSGSSSGGNVSKVETDVPF